MGSARGRVSVEFCVLETSPSPAQRSGSSVLTSLILNKTMRTWLERYSLLLFIGTFILICIVGSLIGSSDSTSTPQTEQSSPSLTDQATSSAQIAPAPTVSSSEEEALARDRKEVDAIRALLEKGAQYESLSISTYAKNPPQYAYKNVEIKGAILIDFLAKGDRGGSTNYLVVADSNDSSAKMVFEVNDDIFKAATTQNKGTLLTAYGLGIPSHEFSLGSGGTALIPAILARKIQ